MPRPHAFLHEELSTPRLFLSWALLGGTLLALVVLAGVLAPGRVFDRHCAHWFRGDEDTLDSPVTPMQFLINGDPIEHESPVFTNWNQNFFFTLTVYRRPKFGPDEARIGFDIFPLKLNIINLDNETELSDIRWDQVPVYEHELQCRRSNLNASFCPLPTAGSKCPEQTAFPPYAPKCGVCRLTVAHASFLSADQPVYRLALRVANKGTQKWAGLLDKDVYLLETAYKYPSEAYTLFEVYFRYLLVFASIIVTMLFWVQNRVYREWRQWRLEQRWTLLLLASVVLFNNPIFFLNIYAEHWVFPFLNTLFINTFLVVYMLCILLFTANLCKPTRRLSAWEFYGPKLCLLGALWLVGLVSFAWTRARQRHDIAHNDLEDLQVSGVGALKGVVGVLLAVYFLWLLYLICRVIEHWSEEPAAHVKRRVKVLWLVAVLMLGAVATGLYVLVLERNEALRPVQFFTLFAMFNLWPYFLAFMYWPLPDKPAAISMGLVGRGGRNEPHPVVGAEDTNALFDDEEDI